MKKKIAMIIIGAIATAMLFGCSSAPNNTGSNETTTEVTSTTTEATTTTTSETTTTAKELSESDFDIQEFLFVPWFDKENTHCVLVLKNNSNESVRVSFNLTAHDKQDSVIGATDASAYFIGPNEETVCVGIFEGVTGVDHITRKMSISDADNKEPEIGSLEAETHVNKNNVVLTIANNGEKEATDFYTYILFFDKNGKIVDIGVTDKIYSLAAGDKTSIQLKTYVKFASTKLYFVDNRY